MEKLSCFNKLAKKQKNFLLEYVMDHRRNAKSAYLKAGYNCNEKAAEVSACRLLSKAKVIEAKKELEYYFAGDDLKGRIIAKLRAIAFTDINDICSWDENGRLTFKTPCELNPQTLAAINEISEDSDLEIKTLFNDLTKDLKGNLIKKKARIKKEDSLKAIEMLAKITGLYNNEENISSHETKIIINTPWAKQIKNNSTDKVDEND